jgi:hypothetical protein
VQLKAGAVAHNVTVDDSLIGDGEQRGVELVRKVRGREGLIP